MFQPDLFIPEIDIEHINKFLKTFTPREETILRFKFGIGTKQKNDIDIVNYISHYSKGFNMAQLKRHYKALNLMVLDKNRKEYGIVFNFFKPELIINNAQLKANYEALKAVYDLQDIKVF